MRQHRILRVIAKLLIPAILMFAFYVQFHGDFGPGGGFQAGVIFSAGIILYALIFALSVTIPFSSALRKRLVEHQTSDSADGTSG